MTLKTCIWWEMAALSITMKTVAFLWGLCVRIDFWAESVICGISIQYDYQESGKA